MKLLVVLHFFAASLDIFVSACEDLTLDSVSPWKDSAGDGCSWYATSDRCIRYGNSWENFGLVANEACCVCGGGTTRVTSSPRITSSPTSSPIPWPYWNEDDNSSTENEDDPTTTVLALLGAVIGMWLVIGCVKVCAKNASQNSNNNAAPSTNLRTRPAQGTPQQTQHAASSIVDERDVRREFILTNIIHKKVVTKSSQSNDDKPDNNVESAMTETSQDNSQSDDIDEGEVIFPHEAIIRERSERIASMRLSLNHEFGDEEQGGAIHNRKDDICIETLRSIRSEMNLHLDMESLDESMYSPKSCPICCEDYVKGDDVAWSKNEECCHAYHTDCIVPWLMDHDDCPMCRCVYVKEGESDEADC